MSKKKRVRNKKIMNSGFQSPAFSGSTNKSFPDCGFGRQKFPGFWNPDYITCGNGSNKAPECWVCLIISYIKCAKQSQGKQYSAAFYSKNYREYGNRPNRIIVYLKRLLTLKLSSTFLPVFRSATFVDLTAISVVWNWLAYLIFCLSRIG